MKNGQRNIFYVYTDHLGSSNVITDAAGAPKERHNFDAWGRERNSADWSYADVQTQCIASLRGYTGHEMLPEFGLINMNGRLYDPVLGRMLSPDPFVQAPGNSQNYNRYSYVLNNPLKFTDPDGEWVNFVIGAVIGGISGWQIGKANGAQGFWEWTGYIGGGMVIGAASSGAAAGVSALGGGAVLAGTAAGAVSGIGFAGLASGWNGNAMVTGGINGAVTGFVGSGFGAAIGGGGGAFVGGAASNITSQLLNNDGKISEINWYSVGTSATVSYGMYEISSYLNWKYEGGNKLGGAKN